MDQNTLVEGGDRGLAAIAAEFRKEGFPVAAIYLIKRISVDGYVDWVVNLVMSPFEPGADRDFLHKLVRLRRDRRLPFIDEQVRVNAVAPDHVEARRVIAYARRLGDPPVVIRNVLWDGLFVEYALVAEFEPREAAVA